MASSQASITSPSGVVDATQGPTQPPLVTTTLGIETRTHTPGPGETYGGPYSIYTRTTITVNDGGTTILQLVPVQDVQPSSVLSSQSTSPSYNVGSTASSAPPFGSSVPQPTAAGNTTSTISTGRPTKEVASPKDGVSPGAVAGAAVGAAVGAGLLAFILAFCLFRRKGRYTSAASGVFVDEKSATEQYPWELYMPQAADDDTIRNAVETLYGQIDMHVENYYGNIAHSRMFNESQASLRMLETGVLPKSVEDMLYESDTPLPVIKHCFAWAIISRLSPTADGRKSLLPAEMARLPVHHGVSKASHERDEQAMGRAYNYWRVLTAQLLYPKGRRAISDAVEKSKVVDTLLTAFAPWSTTSSNLSSAHEHLESVLKSATGLLINSQASTFRFEWVDTDPVATTLDHAIVTFPRFGKIADERGDTIAEVQVLVNTRYEAAI